MHIADSLCPDILYRNAGMSNNLRIWLSICWLSVIYLVRGFSLWPESSQVSCPSLRTFPKNSEDIHKRVAYEFDRVKHKNGLLNLQKRQVGSSWKGTPFVVYSISLPRFVFVDTQTTHASGSSTKNLDTKISTRSLDVLLMGGLHAREWISVSSVLCILLHYLQLYGNYPQSHFYHDLQHHISNDSTLSTPMVTIHFWPTVNPDGYDYSHSSNRHWRKSHPNSNTSKHGVDLNRNFGTLNVSWGFGSKTNYLSELYQGEKPFSEPESFAVKTFVEMLPLNSLVLDIHCCARVVFPAIDTKRMNSSEESVRLAKHIAAKMSEVMPADVVKRYKYREREKNFSASNTGIAVDWINEQPNIGHSFMLEVRGKRNPINFRDLFRNPPTDIEPVANEVAAGLEAAVHYIVQSDRNLFDEPRKDIKYQAKNIDVAFERTNAKTAVIGEDTLSYQELHTGNSLTPSMDRLLLPFSPQSSSRGEVGVTSLTRRERKQLATLHIVLTLCGWCCLLTFWNVAAEA